MIGAALLLLGLQFASVYPYQSLIAIDRIGLSKPVFSLVLVLASLTAVTTAVLFGIWGDQRGSRRNIALTAALAGTLGLGLMIAAPGPLVLILSIGVLLPVASSLYGQLFALARLASAEDGRARDGILGTIRAAMSASFLAMLIYWTFAFRGGTDVMTVFFSAGLASLALLALLWFGWPRDGATAWQDQRSGLNMAQAIREIAHPPVLLRLVLLGALSSMTVLYMVLVSLVFEASALRDTSDVALYVGLVAGVEVPCMLLLPRIALRLPRATLIALGAGLYAVHMLALPLLVDTPLIWIGPLIAGVGGTAMISLPIPYYQDLLAGRPGTASAMLALQKLISDILAAAAFALGTFVGGYATVTVIGVAVAMVGAVGLYLVDRKGN